MRLSLVGSRFGFLTTLALLSSAPALTASSGADDGAPGNGGAAESLGSIGFELQAGSVTLNSVEYAISGPNGYQKSGSPRVRVLRRIQGLLLGG
jgi:hypothetical protein